jgi:hypothetical protein
MKHLLFAWTDPTPLAAELSKPVKRISIELGHPKNGPMFATLWRPDGAGLRLYSQMHDVAERREVGVLNFQRVPTPRPNETIVEAAAAFRGEIVVSKLIIVESGTSAESGVILKASTGDEIVIVAGVAPYSLAVRVAPSPPDLFNPEYPIDRYSRVAIT